MYACAEQIFPDFHFFFKMTKNSHSIFIKMKISFFLHDIPLYPMNGNHTATDLKLSTFYH